MMFVGIIPYLRTAVIQIPIKVAGKISLDGASQIIDIVWVAQKTSSAFYYFLAKRAHVGGHYRQAEAVGQEHYAALEDFLVGKRQYIRGFEVKLGIFIGNKLELADNSLIFIDSLNDPSNFVDVLFGPLFGFAGHNETII